MSKQDAQFVFMTCRAGAEAALKAEVARAMPAWRPAFSRPGFLTFKCGVETALNDKELGERQWTFAHSQCISIGKVVGTQLADLVIEVWNLAEPILSGEPKTPLDIHVWQREPAADEVGDQT